MPDPAHVATDAEIAKIEQLIAKEYKKAHKQVTAKMDDYLARLATKDAKWQQWVANGTKSQAEYTQWKKGQVLMGQRWADLKDSLAQDYVNAAKISQSIANGYRPEVYAINHNYATFEIEKKSQLDTSYTLYSRESVERMYRDNPRLYHRPGQTISQQIKEGKLARWDKRRIQSVITQGILQGESIPNLTKRLEQVTGGDHKAAIRNIRTMMTGVQNAGRIDAQERAKKMGIPVRKQWLATLDSRTRHWHRDLDGKIVETDEPFVHAIPGNFNAEIMFPGDPEAAPVDIYNCRCTLLSAIKGYEIDTSNTDLRHDKNLGKMTYDEWLDAKAPVTSNPIDLPEKKAAAFKQSYINEYAGGHGLESTRHKHTAEEGQRLMDEYRAGEGAVPGAAHVIAEGRDITGTWKRRPEMYDYEIEDIIGAQGFDGLPRVVSESEFERAVKDSKFIAQRVVGAPTQEVMDEYTKQLYYGKWYVDCSDGGATFGQGMYCAAGYKGKLGEEEKKMVSMYQKIRGRNGDTVRTETFTVTPDAKVITFEELLKEEKSVDKYKMLERWYYGEEKSIKNLTSIAALRGYDIVYSETAKETVILNRTKVIFKGQP